MSNVLKIRLLRQFAAAPKPLAELEAVAKQHRMTPDAVRELLVNHGWPNPDAMDRAADALARQPADATPPDPDRAERAAALMASTAPPSARPETAAVVGLDNLLHKGDQSGNARTRALAKKVRDLAGQLQRRITDEANAERLAAAERIRKEKLAKEVAELELELAQKKAALRGRPTSSPSSQPRRSRSNGQVANQEIRAWAEANGIEISARGRIPETVRAQYDAAHQAGAA